MDGDKKPTFLNVEVTMGITDTELIGELDVKVENSTSLVDFHRTAQNLLLVHGHGQGLFTTLEALHSEQESDASRRLTAPIDAAEDWMHSLE